MEPEQKVKKGDLLVSFDLEAIKKEGYPLTTPLIVCNSDDYTSVQAVSEGTVKPGDQLLKIEG